MHVPSPDEDPEAFLAFIARKRPAPVGNEDLEPDYDSLLPETQPT